MKKLISLITALLMTTVVNAYTLSGKITNESNEAMPYVSVYVQDMKTGDISDLDGNYIVTDLEAGHHTIVVSYIGFGTQTLDIDIQQDETRDFILSEQAYTMSEIFVTPNGESIQLFILRQLVEHYQKLGKRVDHFNTTEVGQFEQRNNTYMKSALEGHMGVVNFIFGLIKAKAFITSIMDYPDLKVDTKSECTFKGGLLMDNETKVTHCTPQLNEKELRAWKRITELFIDNGYDDRYKEMSKLLKKVDKMKKKDPSQADKYLTYGGAYDEGNHVVHIIKEGKNEYHIVDGCWQLRRMVKYESMQNDTYDFCEIAQDLYMPVASSRKYELLAAEKIEKTIEALEEVDPTTLDEETKKKYDKAVSALMPLKGKGGIAQTIAHSINYTNFTLKGSSLLSVGDTQSRMVK